jgi:uncharacterized RDD family membrane protein YckC
MGHGQRIASPWRRLASAVVDGSILVSVVGGAIVAWVKLRGDRSSGLRSTGAWTRAVDLAGPALAVPSRNARSPGRRLMGIRAVDARTGGPVTVRTVIIRNAVQIIEKAALREARRPGEAGAQARHDALKSRRDEIRREYANDPEGERRAMRELYRDNAANPLMSCAPFLIAGVADQLAMFVTPRRQTLHELLTGTIVVVDDDR